jgi:GT2 family glycosyltransferase
MNTIGVVTVTYNSVSVIGEFMDSLLRQDVADWRLYVIDNASSDGALARVRRDMAGDPRIVLIENDENRGVAGACNQGIEAARADGCERVLLIDNDVEFGPDLISGMVAEMDRLGAAMLVPKIRYFDPSDHIWCAGGRFRRSMAYVKTEHFGETEIDRGQYDTARAIEYAPTCCMMIRASVFTDIGVMDENYFVYCDDADFCFRAWKAGIALWYTPAPLLFHKVSRLGASRSDVSRFFIIRGQVYFIRKHLARLQALWLLELEGEIILKFFWRIFAGHFPARRFLIEQDAFLEGLRIPLAVRAWAGHASSGHDLAGHALSGHASSGRK